MIGVKIRQNALQVYKLYNASSSIFLAYKSKWKIFFEFWINLVRKMNN